MAITDKYYTILTNIGKAKIANAAGLGTKINFVTMKVGDGGGTLYDPTEAQLDLVHTVWQGAITHVEIDADNTNWINIEVLIPPADGGFFIREYGVFDSDGNMLAIAKCAETYKPLPADGATKEITMKMVLAISNTSSITLKIDPTVIFAKKSEVEVVQTQVDTINAQLSDIVQEQTNQNNNITNNTNNITLKSDKVYTDGKLALKRDKSVKITTNDIDKSSDTNKIHLLDLAEEVQNAMAGTASVIGSVSNGSLTSSKYADKSVLSKHTDFIEQSINRFDKDSTDNIMGSYVSGLGTTIENSSYYISHKFYVNNGDTITIRNSDGICGQYYDANDAPVSIINSDGAVAPYTFIVPGGVTYFRLNGKIDFIGLDMVVNGSSYPTTYIEFYYSLKKNGNNKKIEILESNFETSINLFNKNDLDITINKWIDGTGTINNGDGYFISGKIKVLPSEQFVVGNTDLLTNSLLGGYYTVDNVFIAPVTGVADSNYRTITIPDNTNIAYMKLNFDILKRNSFMIVKSVIFPSTYVSYKNQLKNTIMLNDIQKSQINPLYGKTVLWNGDSIMYGAGWRDCETFLAPANNSGFAKIITENNNMIGYGYGVGGATIAGETYLTDTPMHWVSRDVINMQANADYIIFEGGINDYWLNVPIGTITTDFDSMLDDTTFCGALESLFKQAQLKWKGKKIGFVIVHKIWNTFDPINKNLSELYWNKVREICDKWSIPCLDLFKESGMNTSLKEIRDIYTQQSPNYDPPYGDGCHPLEKGYSEFLSPKVEAWMKTL